MTMALLSVRMTDEEKARLQREADERGVKLSDLVRERLIGPQVVRDALNAVPVEAEQAARTVEVPSQPSPITYDLRVKQLMAQGKTGPLARALAKQEGL